MRNIKKTIIDVTLGLASVLATAFLWEEPNYLIPLLFIFGTMMVYTGGKHILFIYGLSFVLGPVMEIIVINMGGAWNYSQPHILGIPFWLPFLWGNAGLFINRINLFIQGK
ncbi:hypothetical protein HQ403_03275 [Candidatus Kaiserbacteria bacterium]|nr:hypothetical protein [Candidatus Kaiserbacteria bacterium]